MKKWSGSFRLCGRLLAGSENLMPHLVAAVKAYATLGEICDALREVFGVYTEAAIT